MTNDVLAMIAFERAMVNAGYPNPERAHGTDSGYLNSREADRFAGWMLSNDKLARQAALLTMAKSTIQAVAEQMTIGERFSNAGQDVLDALAAIGDFENE